jgi:hypothetical protein
MTDKEKRILEYSLLNWFALMAKSDENDGEISKLIKNINKFLDRRKNDTVTKLESIFLENKLRQSKEVFEKLIVKPEHHKDLDKDIDLPTISYSPTILAIQCLDDMILNGDTTLRTKFGHIDTGKMLLQIEEYDGNLTMDSMKLYFNLKKEIGL